MIPTAILTLLAALVGVFAHGLETASFRVVIGTTLFAFPASYVSLEVTTTKIGEPSPPDLFPLTLEISVTHSGFQINAEDVNLLFRPCLAFCKDSKSSNLTGLEMSIVKSMVNLMGGSITAVWNEGAAHGGYCEIKISIPIIGSRASDSMHDFSITKEVSTSMLDFPIRQESNEYLSSLTERIRLMKFPHLLSNSCASSFKFDIRAGRDVATELASNTGSTSSEVAVDIEPPSILNFSPLQSKRKLLIADTSREFRLEFKKMIENLTTDYVVFEASSCDEVILIMETDRIDIVFIELEMAKVKEYAQRRKFQQNSVSVIGMGTQSISAIQKNRLKALGLNYIIAKPISKGILLSLLKTFNTSRNVQFQKTQSLSDLENNYGESAYAKYSPTSPYSNAEVSFSPAESVSSEFSYRSTPIICRQRCDSLDSMSPQSINVHIFPQQQALDTNRLLALVVESSSPHRHTLVKILQNLGIFQDIFESSNELDAARLCSARKFSMIFIGVYPDMTEINDMIRRSRIEDIPVVVLMDSEQLCMPNPLDSSATLYRPVSSEEMESVIRKLLPKSKLDWVRDSETIVAEGGKRKESVATLVGLHL
ncbi:hypothetical protein HDU79_009363 [Rhizoclosmatium sp. JEL0117]|nr:hypothetical protein HDU79_009363 [Rhizoclosmatium sp. JEL0117]